MGCFLGCFGSSKDQTCRKQRNKVLPRNQRHGGEQPVLQAAAASLEQEDHTGKLIHPVSPLPQDKPEEKLYLSPRKKVTFDSNVKTYEHISEIETEEHTPENTTEKARKRTIDRKGVENFPKSSQSSHSGASEDGSVVSSLGSNPLNYRYQNCRDSDDEVEESEEDDESDLDDEEELEEEDYNDFDDENAAANRAITEEEICSPMIPTIHGTNRNVRVRSAYVHAVLNPVENISQWKAVKGARGKRESPLKQEEDFFISNQEQPRISFSLEPTFQESSSFSFRVKSDQPKNRTTSAEKDEIAVDMSLSNWLGSSSGGSTPPITINKKNADASNGLESEKSRASYGSNSAISFEDRPILGALSVEQLWQISASVSPRRSLCRSPDEMPIIGTVGSYWGHTDETEDSGSVSVSSYKGIPNTTSKYTEDKRVNWHSTPFETRLERALNRGSAACR